MNEEMAVYVVLESSTCNGGGSIHDCCEVLAVCATERIALEKIRDTYAEYNFPKSHGDLSADDVQAIRDAKCSDVWLDEIRTWIETKEMQVS